NLIAVPQRFKQRIGKTEGQDVLYRFLTEVMVYAVYLLLLECPSQQLIKRYGRLLVVTEGFFNDNPIRFWHIGQLVFVDVRGRRFDELRCNGEVKQPVGPYAPLLVKRIELFSQPLVGSGIIDVRLKIRNGCLELVPLLLVGLPLPGKLRQSVMQVLPIGIIVELGTSKPDDGKFLGHPPIDRQVVKRWD